MYRGFRGMGRSPHGPQVVEGIPGEGCQVVAESRVRLDVTKAPDQLGSGQPPPAGSLDRNDLRDGPSVDGHYHLFAGLHPPEHTRCVVAKLTRRHLNHATNVAPS